MDYVVTICTVTGVEAELAVFAATHIKPYEDAPSELFFSFWTVIPNPAEDWGTLSPGLFYKLRVREHGKMIFYFETERTFPLPIFRRLAAMYPGLVFHVVVYEETYMNQCTGEGEFNGKDDFHAVDPKPALAALRREHAARTASTPKPPPPRRWTLN